MIMVVMGIGFLLNNPHNQIHGGPTGADMGFFGSRVRFLGLGCVGMLSRRALKGSTLPLTVVAFSWEYSVRFLKTGFL